MSNFKNNHPKQAYQRDVYLAYLVEGARRTKIEGYPIIEGWMVADRPPDDVVQWDCRHTVKDSSRVGMSFYCVDPQLKPILNNPKGYVEKLSKYQCVLGMDASPYDNMPPVVQKSQIFCNLAITYYFGKNCNKIIPNVRVGTPCTYDSLEAYPRHHLISIGTNGFIWELKNRMIFKDQVGIIVNELQPSGIIVYGSATEEVFESALAKKIPIFQYDSYMMNRNRLMSQKKKEASDER